MTDPGDLARSIRFLYHTKNSLNYQAIPAEKQGLYTGTPYMVY